jgi:hypothetical protein
MQKALLFLIFPLRWLFTWAVALVILFEEWGWEPLQRLLHRIVALLHLQKLEAWLRTLPPYAAMVALALPSLMLLPAKLAAFALLARGQIFWGSMVFIAAKLIGTAVIARIFSIVQPSLMQLGWFARIYTAWKRWKDALLARIRATPAWQRAKAFKARLSATMRALFKA